MRAIGTLLARFGALSPLATFSTFSPGARELLLQAERSGELALHAVRAVWWSVAIAMALVHYGLPLTAAAPAIAAIAVVWVIGVLGLRTTRAFAIARYGLIVVDAWVVLGAMIVGRVPAAADIGAYVPPMLVYLALTGALRLDPRVAALSSALATAGAVLYTVSRGVEVASAVLLVGLVVLSSVVATNASRVLRYVMLKAREEAILESYVPESLPRDLASHGGLERAGRVEDVTLLLCDIRGFTKLSERLSPAETVTLVNSYLDAVCPPIAGAGGVIDKFMGDGVLAFFEGGGNASRALISARRVLEAVDTVELAGGQLRVGIALHSGEVLVGTVGPRTRREYTIISDAVNTLSRLEEMNKMYGSAIVASAATIAHVTEAERAGFQGPVDVSVRGRDAGVQVYVYGAVAGLGDDGDLSSRLRRFVGRDSEEPG